MLTEITIVKRTFVKHLFIVPRNVNLALIHRVFYSFPRIKPCVISMNFLDMMLQMNSALTPVVKSK